MSFSTYHTEFSEAKRWYKYANGYAADFINDDGTVKTKKYHREVLEKQQLLFALDNIYENFQADKVAEYFTLFLKVKALSHDKLFTDEEPEQLYTWAKWTYFRLNPVSINKEVTLLFQVLDGTTLPLSMPEIIWRVAYPDVMNRYAVALSMGLDAYETASYCQPSYRKPELLDIPSNLVL